MSTAVSRRADPGLPRDARTFLPIRRILCPIDFSDLSLAAAARAMVLARPFRAEVTVLFVLPLLRPEDAAACCGPVAPEAAVQSAVAEDLEEFLRPVRDAGVDLRLCLRTGDCVGHILDEARDREIDLIAMGTHGASGLERWALGSVTHSVLRRAACPVLIVPRRAAARPAPARIVCGIGLSSGSARTASYALSLAAATGARLTLVHAWGGAAGPRASAASEAERRRWLHALAEADSPRGAVEEVVVSGRPAREVLRVAEAQQAGLIVLGAGDQGPGPTARRILRDASCPVLTVRRG
jgi:nucleotide-binding universal stress UspA family protein